MAKLYTKNTWVDEVLAGNERYNILEDGGSAFKSNMRIDLATSVTQAGTAVDATKMNNLENGVDAIDTLLDTVNGKVTILTSQGDNIASGSAVNIGAATGQTVTITGNTTITSFGTADAGIIRILKFTGTPLITYNATLMKLPRNANYQVAVGDVLAFESEGSGNWKCIFFTSEVATEKTISGWTLAAVQPTRTTADDPTYTAQFANIDLSAYLVEGAPVKWTQNSIVRYGWISAAPVYSAGNTTVTILTRLDSASADYDMLDTSTYPVTAFAWGIPRQPGAGFPTGESFWTLTVTDVTLRSQASPSAGTWYNLGSVSITKPIGRFMMSYSVSLYADRAAAGGVDEFSTLSTANNSESDSGFTNVFYAAPVTALQNQSRVVEKLISGAKATYYLNSKVGTAGLTTLINGNNNSALVLTARCAYL